MEESGIPQFERIKSITRKKRSQTSRRPKPETLPFPETVRWSPLSSMLLSDDMSKISSDENTGVDTSPRWKEFNLNQCALRGSASRTGEYPLKKTKEGGSSRLSYDNGDFGDSADWGESVLNHRRFSEAVWKSTSKTNGSLELQPRTTDIHGRKTGEIRCFGNSRVNGDRVEDDKKVKMVKLKVGGITCTIQRKSNLNGMIGIGSSTRSARTSDAQSLHKLIFQEHSPMGKMPEKNASGNQGGKSEPVRKSKRVPKRRVMDAAFDKEDDDDEIRYLEKLKFSKFAAGNNVFEEESRNKKQRISRVPKDSKHDEILEGFVPLRSSKDSMKKSRSERGSVDTDYDEEEELVSDGEPEGKKKKPPRKDSVVSPNESKRELALTTRQRALLSSKDAPSTIDASVIEFPNGLPPAPSRKQKEKLSEVEQQLKKTEAAQRRRMQVEKAAQESEAEAIRKILGQDSSRKKREDKMKQRREVLEQEKAANALVLASNTIRWVMGPTGTVVTFSNDMGWPNIFNPNKPCSYPSPRERCVGPSCTNSYKYRDSKSKLPLCSLQCYKAIHEKLGETTS